MTALDSVLEQIETSCPAAGLHCLRLAQQLIVEVPIAMMPWQVMSESHYNHPVVSLNRPISSWGMRTSDFCQLFQWYERAEQSDVKNYSTS